jgi:lycopene beta-cyclase
MLAGVLLRARGVARAVAAAFRMGADTNAVARAGWQALWPEDRQAARRLQCFGMELLRTLDGAQQRAFFSAYFQAAQEKWPALMGFQATAAEITAIMEKAFSLFPLPLKMRASLLLTVRHPTLVPQLARTLLGGPPAHRALPPAP